MVNFTADHVHFSSALCMINTFRIDSSFCDVKLIIGKKSLQAHKCVLAAGSPYFRSLFLGQFTEAKMDEINLSEVTSSITALERIVNFIYTGEIDIDDDNLEVIIKLSSFFLIESLKEICCTFMTDNLSLTTCLKYYLFSVDHGVFVVEQKTWPMVQSRFHDHLIYEEDTLSISTNEMQILLEQNILKHCSDVRILMFMAMWVNKGLTKRHMKIAKGTFAYVIERVESPQVSSIQLTNELSMDSLYEMTEASLNDIAVEGRDLFLNSFKEVLGKITTENEVHTAEMSSQACHNAAEMSSQAWQNGKETAIIAMFPSKDLVEHQMKILWNPALSLATFATDRLILHVCAYIPRTKCWYSLKKIYNDGSSSALFIDESEYQLCMFDLLHDELYFQNDGTLEITVNNLNSLENSGIKSCSLHDFLQSESDDMDSLYQYVVNPDFCLTAGKHDSVYLVCIFKRFESADLERLSGIFCNGYKLLENGNMWQKIFQTEIKAHPSLDYGSYNDVIQCTHAKISTVSNEMIVHVGEFNTVLVADLNQENTNPVTVLYSDIDLHSTMDIAKRTQIIETNDAMFIVTDGTTNTTNDKGILFVMYKYKLNSKQLRDVNSTVVNVSQFQENSHGSYLYPCLSASSASVGDGLWYMEGIEDASFLIKVTVDDDECPVTEQHTPPPFPSIYVLFASRISSQILENKEIITRYLGNE